MKHLFPTLSIFFLSSAFSFSQTLTSEKNSYRAGDYLTKQQVEYRDAGSSGRNLTWDFRHLQTVNEDYILKFSPRFSDEEAGDEICGLEHNTRYYYVQKSDSLLASGYENSTTLMNYTQPELKLRFPFAYGDTLYSEFEGAGEYGRRLPLAVKGWTRVHADAAGNLLLPGGTVNRALRVHTVRHYTETRRAAVEITLDTYSWYAQGARYPVFESVKTVFHNRGTYRFHNEYDNSAPDDTVIFTTSFYYPPKLQLSEMDELSQNAEPQGAAAVFTEAAYQPNPVISTLSIDYKLTRNAQIWFTLHNNQGVVQRTTQPVQQNAGYRHAEISMGGLLTGVYTLYVHVDDMVMQANIIKQ